MAKLLDYLRRHEALGDEILHHALCNPQGIRDLYYIRIVRLGYRKEGQENEDKNDLRLVFEIERLGQLFDDYKKVKLEIWRTFTDTTMEKIL